MTQSLLVRRRAELQAAKARDWYNEQLDGLGRQFIGEIDAAILKAYRHPLHYQVVHRDIRRVLLRRFPYAVFFVAEPARVVVLAVLHQSEDPEKWPQIG
jgi:plasmid stabilization system protein ParE